MAEVLSRTSSPRAAVAALTLIRCQTETAAVEDGTFHGDRPMTSPYPPTPQDPDLPFPMPPDAPGDEPPDAPPIPGEPQDPL